MSYPPQGYPSDGSNHPDQPPTDGDPSHPYPPPTYPSPGQPYQQQPPPGWTQSGDYNQYPSYPQQTPYAQQAPYTQNTPFAQYGPPNGVPPQRSGSGKALAVIAGVSLLVIAALVAVVIVVVHKVGSADVSASGNSSSSGDTYVPTSAESSPTTTTPTTTETVPQEESCPTATAAPTTPAGWKTVAGKRHLAYDVPANWKVLTCTTIVGWEKKCDTGPFGYCPIRSMSGASALETPQCPKNDAGVAGLPGASQTPDINEAVRAEGNLVADIYTSDSGHVPTVTLGPPRSFTVGGAPAVQVLATVTDIETSQCVGPTAIHSMVATTVPGQKGSVMFVISLPQGVPDAADPAIIDQMVGSLRPTD